MCEMCEGVWGYPYKQYNLSTKDTLHLYCFQSPPTKGQPLSIKQSAKVSICVKTSTHTHTHTHTHSHTHTYTIYRANKQTITSKDYTRYKGAWVLCCLLYSAFYKIHAGTQYMPIQVCEPVRSFV